MNGICTREKLLALQKRLGIKLISEGENEVEWHHILMTQKRVLHIRADEGASRQKTRKRK